MARQDETVSDELRKAVKEYHSIYALARDSEVPESVLQRFANRQRGLTLATVDKLAVFFGMRLTRPTSKPPRR